MNRKRKTAIIALLSVFTATAMCAGCEAAKKITEVSTDEKYGYQNPDVVYAQPDEGFTIDGKADEEAYKNAKWVQLNNQNGNDTVDLAMTSYFGEKGMYFIYDVTESTPIYVNHDRASYINSGIEMYFAPQGVASMSNDHIYEIDLEADGTLTFKKSAGVAGSWTDVRTTNDIMARLASQPKGGEINSGECYGYTLEFFMPWDYIEYLGMTPETMKEEYVSVNPVHITSYNYAGTVYETDRYWYPFATQLGGDGWNNVGQYFRFDKNGVVGTVPVTLGKGVHCTLSGPAAVIPGLPAKVTVTPEEGYAVSSLRLGDEERIQFVSYNKDGSATYTVTAESGMTFTAEAEKVTEGNKNLTGKINLKKAGGDTLDGLSASYFDASGEHELPLNEDGAFSLNDLAQGYYTIVAEKKGYGKISRSIYLNRNIETQIDLEYGMFAVTEGSCWDISAANEGYLIKKGGRGIILSQNSYDTVYAEGSFLYDEALAAHPTNNDDKEQRAGIRMKFSGGKYWSVTVIRAGESYVIMYAQHNAKDFIFGWNSVHTMTAKEIAKYKSAEGIKLGILRVGTKAYLYLDGELVHSEDLGGQGIKADETVQIGYEGFYYNSEAQEIKYSIEENDADVISLGEVNVTGATAALDDTYKVGENVVLVLNKANNSDVLLSLLVNGEEMSGAVESDGNVDVLTLANYKGRKIDVEAVYGTPREITANITVDGAWGANGVKFTFINAANDTLVKTATVQNNKMTIENMLQGRWLVKANVFGKEIDMGSYSVVSEEEKQLDPENVFIGGNKLDSSVVNLSTGSFVYHSAIDEDYSVRINEQGDAFLAAKVSLSVEDKAKLLNNGEVSFGMYMTVEDANGKPSTHWTDFWIKNADGQDWLTVRTDFGWGEDFCKPFSTNVDSNKYSKALFGDGLYVVLRYKAETGVMETYFGENDFNVKYLRDWNADNGKFPAGGTVVQAGFRDNLTWGGTSVSVNVEGFRYGKTLLEALGVAGKTVEINPDYEEEKGAISFDKNSYTAGDDIVCTIAANDGYFLQSVTVNGLDFTHLVGSDSRLVLNDYTAVELNVNAVFMQAQNLADVTLTVDDAWNAEGLNVTLTREGFDNITGTVTNGQILLKNVMQGTWTVNAELFGAPVSTTLIIIKDTAFDLGNLFVNAPEAKGNVNLAESKLTYHGDRREDLGIKTSVTGDAWILGKVSLSKDDFNKIMNGGQVPFGMYVKFSDGTYKYISLNLANKQGDMHLCLTDGDWWEDGHQWGSGCSTHLGTINSDNTYELNKYGEALRGDGLYYILNYNSSTGYLSVYYATGTGDVILAKEMAHAPLTNGTIVNFGVNRGIGWGETDVTFNVSEFRYGKTLAEAFGIAGQKITVTGAGQKEHGMVAVTENAERGDDVTITLTPADRNYKIATLTVNGSPIDVTKLTDGTYTLKNYLSAELTVDATFVEIEKVDVEISLTGKKLGLEGNAANGLEATLSDGTFTYKGTVADGKVTFDQVVTGDNYRLSIEGFIEKTGLTVTESGIEGAITLEYDTFYTAMNWGSFDFGKQNNEVPEISFTNDCCIILTKDTYDDVMTTVYLSGKGFTKGSQGIAFRFVGDGVSDGVVVRMQDKEKVQFYADDLWSGDSHINKAEGSDWQDLIFFQDGDNYLEAYDAGTLKLSVVRKGATFYVFLNDTYIGQRTFNAKYENMKVEAGYFSHSVDGNVSKTWKVGIAEKEADFPPLEATITNGTTDTNGTIELSKTTATLGKTITVTVSAKQGYKLATLKVNGTDVTAQMSGNVYNLTVVGNTTVVAEFTQIIPGSLSAEVFGKKFGVKGNALTEGTVVTLKSAGLDDVTATVTADGKISVASVPAGVWTVHVDGYTDVQITVLESTEYTNAITLEYQDAFVPHRYWGSFDWSHVNDAENAKFVASNGCEMVTTKDTYGDVAFTLYLGGNDKNGGNQGIYFLFGNEVVAVRAENGAMKIHFTDGLEWMVENHSMASGSGWQNLIHLKDNNEGNAVADAQSYLDKFTAGTLKLTVVRRGATFYVFLDDTYIGQRTYDSKYANTKANIGICWSGLEDGKNKDWKFELSEALPPVSITNATTDANGTVTLSSLQPHVGDKVTLTVTPKEGYILKSLIVGGKDVTGFVSIDRDTLVATYEFNATVATEVAATFEQAVFGNINVSISGAKYGQTEAVDLSGTTVTLSGKTEYSAVVTGGKLTLTNVSVGEYTLTADGYVSQTVTVTESGIAGEIVLVYNIFTSAPGSADLSKLGEGKVTATGNGGVDLETQEKYTNVTAEAHFDVPDYNGRRYGIALVFDDGKNFRVDFAVQDGGNNILQQTNWGSMMFNWEWVDFPADYFAAGTNSYSEQEIRDEFIAKGLTYKLERDGATVKLYINGVLMKTYTLPEEYANQSAKLKFIFDSNGTDGTKGFTFDITVPKQQE